MNFATFVLLNLEASLSTFTAYEANMVACGIVENNTVPIGPSVMRAGWQATHNLHFVIVSKME